MVKHLLRVCLVLCTWYAAAGLKVRRMVQSRGKAERVARVKGTRR